MAIEIASSCQGTDGWAMMIVRSREVGGDVVEQHRGGVAQLDPAAAGQAGADAGLSGVEQRGHAELLQRLVERVEAHVVRLERLQARVELEPAHAVLGHEPARPGTAAFPACGSTEPNGIRTSACSAAASAISSLDSAGCPVPAGASTVKTTAAMLRAR